ncbi:MAG: sulfite exporter TauE/SafE family protein [Caldilinea sp.]|nr:sulfite exporter TauE/SafE family protein [Caldilinea sp.]MCB9114253.1 sulfite exporter TauE/SafE family protein [Caldilineaceae bacterium]MCB0041140.1 sulfite exporter TauE/SafE family protein [Caldilinea sp.]MCB9120879.1 sulfite exporter TauE/SafE family protein [Caldilineaceae bacterium]MCB9123958.1 sulfite exporter TauE/SafE family protein [Caldilineaceae bacterium]
MANSLGNQVAAPAGDHQQVKASRVGRWTVFLHALFFVLGFTLVFTVLGSAAGLLGRSLNVYMPVIQKLGAILLVIFALTTLGLFRWLVNQITARVDVSQNPAAEALVSVLNFPNRMLYTEKRVTDMHEVNRGWGYLSSSLMGISFAAGWVPCVGPILASILFLAGDSQTAWQGAGLLLVYSLGLGIPFLLTGLAFNSMTKWLRAMNRHAGIISIISGIFMLYVAWLLWSDSLALLTTQFIALNEWVFQAEDMISSFVGGGHNLIGASNITAILLAFSAGLISFLSPCVLPLVPAYIGYLSGTAVGARPQS